MRELKPLTAAQALLDVGYAPQAAAIAAAIESGDESEAGRLLAGAIQHVQAERLELIHDVEAEA